MLLALSSDEQRIMPTKDEPGFCPGCECELVPKMGEINVWHWSHRPNHKCSYGRLATYWQYEWLAFYHEQGFEIETLVGDYYFHAIDRDKKLAIMLAAKASRTSWEEFITKATNEGLAAHIIFSPAVFKSHELIGQGFKARQRSDTMWHFFWKHAQKGHRQTAKLWLDIEADIGLDFGMKTGIYALGYDNALTDSISVSAAPKAKQMTPKSKLRG